jgi:hypothetical protein
VTLEGGGTCAPNPEESVPLLEEQAAAEKMSDSAIKPFRNF